MKPEDVVKGRIAETLVDELLRKSEWHVYRFGYEAVLQNLTQAERGTLFGKQDIQRQIRSIPDFLVVKNRKPLFIEVKFRSVWKPQLNPDFEEDADLMAQLNRVNQFWKARIIFVTIVKPYFRIVYPPYYSRNHVLGAFPLESDYVLNIDKKLLPEFNALVEKYLVSTRRWKK